MDDVDRELIRLLRRDARRPWTDLADEVGVSEGTVRSRVEALQDEGVIRRFTVEASTGLVEALVEADVATDVETGAVSADVRDLPGVRRVWEVAGSVDLVVHVDAGDPADLDETVEGVRGVEGVTSTRSHVVLKRK